VARRLPDFLVTEAQVPGGWITAQLGAIAEVNPHPLDSSKFPDRQPVGFIPMAAVDAASGSVSEVEERPLREVRGKSFRTFQEGDILFAKITPSMENGKAAIVPALPSNLGFGSTEFHVLRPARGIDPRYLWRLIRAPRFRAEAKQHMTGSVGQLRVPTGYLRGVTVPLPPAAEQRRIAECLEGLGQRRSAAGDRLKTARANLEHLRRAVLAAACSGRLSEDWRGAHSDASAEPLLVELLEARQDSGGRRKAKPHSPGLASASQIEQLPSSWRLVRLGSLFEVTTGATPLRKNPAYYENGTIPWVTSGAVNAGTITAPTELITPLALEETNVKLFPEGTLLVAMYGEGQTRGRVAELGIEAGTNQAVAAILFSGTQAPLRPFVRLFFEDSYQRVRAKSAGGVQPNLNLGMLQDTMLPLPPPEEQAELVKRAQKALAITEALAAEAKKAGKDLSRLDQAALSMALKGKLVPTEAELASEAGVGFESARELLENLSG
jgi:type I restriction enzyme S subunit